MDETLLKYVLLWATVIAAGALLVLRSKGTTSTAKSVDDHQRWAPAKPTSGGLLFALSIGLGQLLMQPLPLWVNVALFAGFGIGWIDDVRRIGPYTKLIGQLVAATTVALFVSQFTSNVAWIILMGCSTVFMMNSINMLDNMDGVSSVGSLPFGLVGALLFLAGDITSQLGVFMVVGLLSFLLYNAHPSKMFMGDSGSMLLGVMAPLIMWEIYIHHPTLSLKLLPLWVFMSTLTVADTFLVVIRRLQHGKSPMQGGRDHSTHHLVYYGWSQNKVAYVFLAMALFQSVTAFLCIALHWNHLVLYGAMVIYVMLWVSFIWYVSEANLKSGKFEYASHG